MNEAINDGREFLKTNFKWIAFVCFAIIVLWLKSLFVTKTEAEAHNAELEALKVNYIEMNMTVKNHTKILDAITEIKLKEK